MNYKESIYQAIAFIEDNLKNDISVTDVAGFVGYSEYHFIHVFRKVVHLTPADYIRKRRISEIVRCMEHENRPISEIAFEYGFNSKENFVRAFKREHHILPTEFKAAQNSLKLYEPLRLEAPCFCPGVKFVYLDSFQAVVYKCDEEYPPNFWNKYNAKMWSKRLSGGKTVEDIGISVWNPAMGGIDYYIGIRKEEAEGELSGTVILDIPGGQYAVFETPPTTHFNFVNNIHRTWDYINRIWLPQSGYRRTGGCEFECYVEESRSYSERIYIPVTKK